MEQKLYIPVILGTAREGRQSESVAKYILAEAEKYGFETELIDVRGLGLAKTGDSNPEYMEKVKKADGYIIVSPEYNHGYPGELKMALDQAYEEYNRKPVAICGVSAGGLGGARMTEVLRITLIEFQMVPTRNAVYFSGVGELFDKNGNIKDGSYSERTKTMFDELSWYSGTLKNARQS